MSECAGSDVASSSPDTQPASGGVACRPMRRPPQVIPYSLHRNDCHGPSVLSAWAEGSNSSDVGGTEQSSSLVMKMMAKKAFGLKKPRFSAGALGPSAASVEPRTASKPHPLTPTSAMQPNTSLISPS